MYLFFITSSLIFNNLQTIINTSKTNNSICDYTSPTFHQLVTQINPSDLSFQDRIFLNTEVNKTHKDTKSKKGEKGGTRLKIWQQGLPKEEDREISMRNKFAEIKNSMRSKPPSIVGNIGNSMYINPSSL